MVMPTAVDDMLPFCLPGTVTTVPIVEKAGKE